MEIACTGAKLCAHMASCFQATQSFAPHGICAKNRPTNQMRQLKELKEYIYIYIIYMSKEDYRNYSNASGLHLSRGEEKYHICLSTCRCWSFVTWHIPTPSWKPNSNKLVTRKSFLTGKVKWVLFSSEKWEKMTRYQVLDYESLLANKAL